MAIAIDASGPVVASNTASTAGTITTASFTPPANSLLVAICGQVYNGSTSSSTFSVSDSLSGTWTTSAKQLGSAGKPNVGVFTRFVTSSAAMTVTLTTDTASQGHQLRVVVLTGTATSSWTGGTAVSISTMNASVTTTTAGSMVFGNATYDNGVVTLTPSANTTVLTDTPDSPDGGEMVSFRSTSAVTTPGATAYGVTGATTPCSYAAAEILPAAAGITYIGKYTPATNPTSSTATPTVSVTVGAGDTLVLAIGGSSPATVTTPPSGGGLTWTQQVAKNPTGSFGCLYMYTATSLTAQTFTLTATMSSSTLQYDVVVARYSGVGGVGVTGSNNASTGNPTLTVTTTAANSYLHVSGDDWNPASGAATWTTTAGTPTTIADDLGSSVAGHHAYYQLTTAGSKTVGMSAPTGQVWILGGVELTPGATSTPISLADTGSGNDAFAIVGRASALPDTAAGADALTVPTVQPVLAETVAAADALTVTANTALSDTAAAADALPTVATRVALSDAGSGADLLAVGGAPHSLADTAGVVDALAVTVRVPLPDTAAGTDAGIGRVIALTDTASASDVSVGGNKAILADQVAAVDHLGVIPPTITKIGLAVLASGGAGFATLASGKTGLATLKVQLKG